MLSSGTKTALRTEIQTKEAQLAAAQTALTAALTEIESYRLDTGEGSQQTKYRDPEKLMKAISYLEAQIRSLYGRLNGTGVVNVNVRRKWCGGTRLS